MTMTMEALEALRDHEMKRLDASRVRVVQAQRTSAIVKMGTVACLVALVIVTTGMLIAVGFTPIGIIPIAATIALAIEYPWLSKVWQTTVMQHHTEMLRMQDRYINRVIDVEDRRQLGLMNPEEYAMLEHDSEEVRKEKAQFIETSTFEPYAHYPPPRWVTERNTFHIERQNKAVSDGTYHKAREGETLAELNHRIVEENKTQTRRIVIGRWY